MSRMDDTQRWRCLFCVVHCTSGIWSSYVIVISDEQEQTKWMIVYIPWLICYSCKQSMGMRTSNECFSTRRFSALSLMNHQYDEKNINLDLAVFFLRFRIQSVSKDDKRVYSIYSILSKLSETFQRIIKLERCMKLRITVIYTEKKLIDHIKSQLVLDWAFEYDAYWHRVH